MSQVEGKAIDATPHALAQQLLEIRLRPQPTRGVEAEALAFRGYSPRRLRPLARRLASTFLPPAVRLRTRNPWVRARRVFEGW